MKVNDDDKATFVATFPCIQGAIKVTGDRQGMRLQLDVPESEMHEAVKLLMWRQRVLRVTIEPEDDSGVIGRRAAKKRVQPGDPGV